MSKTVTGIRLNCNQRGSVPIRHPERGRRGVGTGQEEWNDTGIGSDPGQP